MERNAFLERFQGLRGQDMRYVTAPAMAERDILGSLPLRVNYSEGFGILAHPDVDNSSRKFGEIMPKAIRMGFLAIFQPRSSYVMVGLGPKIGISVKPPDSVFPNKYFLFLIKG